jgi:CheY-specific phosphatase CheX
MKTKIKSVLETSSVTTFEDVCFMYQVPELKKEQKKLKPDAVAEVKYKGDHTGRLVIETYGDLFSAIAANMLSDESPGLHKKKDALGEIANIICGNVVASLGRSEKGYKIGSPRSLKKEEWLKEKKTDKPFAEISLNFNEGRADIKFFVDGEISVKEKKIDKSSDC